MKNEGNPCGSCKLSYMREHGCCTSDVGFGRKVMVTKRGPVLVCKKLQKTITGQTFCGIYNSPEKPSVCSQFMCPKLTGEDDDTLLDDAIGLLPDANDDAWGDHGN